MREFEPDSLLTDVVKLTELGWRRNGSPAAAQAAELFRREFVRLGCHTVVETWPYNAYYPLEWGVSVTSEGWDGPPSVQALPVWYSSPGSATGELIVVDAQHQVPALDALDVRDKVLLVDLAYQGNFLPSDASSTKDSGLYAAAVQGGAIGYLRRSGAPHNSPSLLHFAQNFPTHRQDAEYGDIPAFTVGSEDFDRLRDTHERTPTTVTLSLALADVPKGGHLEVTGGSLGEGRHLLRGLVDDVVGILPGVKTETIVVASHYDSTFDGAVDNATGNAVLLALARHYAAQPLRSRPKTLVFLASGGHDTGDFDLYHFVEKHAEDILLRTVAFNWLDHLAADDTCSPPGRPVARGLIAAENTRLRRRIREVMGEHGVAVDPIHPPMSTVSHLPAYVPTYNLTLAPAWYHSALDTVDKVPAQQLAVMARAQRDLLDALMHEDGAALRSGNPHSRRL